MTPPHHHRWTQAYLLPEGSGEVADLWDPGAGPLIWPPAPSHLLGGRKWAGLVPRSWPPRPCIPRPTSSPQDISSKTPALERLERGGVTRGSDSQPCFSPRPLSGLLDERRGKKSRLEGSTAFQTRVPPGRCLGSRPVPGLVGGGLSTASPAQCPAAPGAELPSVLSSSPAYLFSEVRATSPSSPAQPDPLWAGEGLGAADSRAHQPLSLADSHRPGPQSCQRETGGTKSERRKAEEARAGGRPVERAKLGGLWALEQYLKGAAAPAPATC